MDGLTHKELLVAKGTWYFDHYHFRDADRDVDSYLLLTYSGAWLERARRALFLTTGTMAERIGVSRSAYCKIEKAEVAGTITLKTLHQCAQALDCELVYAIRPKNQKNFSQQIWDTLYAAVKGHHGLKYAEDKRRAYLLYGLVSLKMTSPRFRRQMGWGNNINRDDE